MKHIYLTSMILLCFVLCGSQAVQSNKITKQKIKTNVQIKKTFTCPRCQFDLSNRRNIVLASRHVDSRTRPLTKQDQICLMKIVKRESGFRVNAKNRRSTAFGLGQLLKSTYKSQNRILIREGKKPISYGNLCPSCQIEIMRVYITHRYGSPTRAEKYWRRHRSY